MFRRRILDAYDKYVILLDLITILLHCENFDEQIRKHYMKFLDIHKENRKIGRVLTWKKEMHLQKTSW